MLDVFSAIYVADAKVFACNPAAPLTIFLKNEKIINPVRDVIKSNNYSSISGKITI